MIEATLVGLNWMMCLPYLDDIIIWANGDTEEEAFEQSMERLDLVLAADFGVFGQFVLIE